MKTTNSSIYQAPSSAWVFGAGTTSWSWGLDYPGVTDAVFRCPDVLLSNGPEIGNGSRDSDERYRGE